VDPLTLAHPNKPIIRKDISIFFIIKL